LNRGRCSLCDPRPNFFTKRSLLRGKTQVHRAEV
jgi:hypothetical protein